MKRIVSDSGVLNEQKTMVFLLVLSESRSGKRHWIKGLDLSLIIEWE